MANFNFKREIKWDKDVMKVTDSLSSIWDSIVDEMTEKTKSKQTDEVLRHFDIDMSELREYLRDKEEWKRKQTAAIPHWIPVTERLPVGGDDSGDICENVCLMLDDGTVSCGWMNGITKKVYYLNAREDFIIKAPITRVTHWMPLPEPPKEDDYGEL